MAMPGTFVTINISKSVKSANPVKNKSCFKKILTFDWVMFLDHLVLSENIRRDSFFLCSKLDDHWVTPQHCSSAQ